MLDRLVFKIGFIDQYHDFSVTVEDRRSRHPNWPRGNLQKLLYVKGSMYFCVWTWCVHSQLLAQFSQARFWYRFFARWTRCWYSRNPPILGMGDLKTWIWAYLMSHYHSWCSIENPVLQSATSPLENWERSFSHVLRSNFSFRVWLRIDVYQIPCAVLFPNSSYIIDQHRIGPQHWENPLFLGVFQCVSGAHVKVSLAPSTTPWWAPFVEKATRTSKPRGVDSGQQIGTTGCFYAPNRGAWRGEGQNCTRVGECVRACAVWMLPWVPQLVIATE